jgi:hypothetical protein
VTCATLIVSDPLAVVSATEVATIVTVAGFGAVVGAVYVPVVDVAETMVPQGFPEPVQAVPLRLHVTAVVLVLLTVAVNVRFVCVT